MPSKVLALVFCVAYAAEALRLSGRPRRRGDQQAEQLATARACVETYAAGLDQITAGLGDPVRAINLTGSHINPREVFIGAGLGTTATHSIHTALHLLGKHGVHYSCREQWCEWYSWGKSILAIFTKGRDKNVCRASLAEYNYGALPDSIEYVLDSPTAEVFLHLFANFPNGKFLLSTRPTEAWAKSRKQEHGNHAPLPVQDPCERHIKSRSFAELGQMFDLHNELVRCVVPKDRLIEFDVFADSRDQMGSLMQRLADFVGVDALVKRFPGSRFAELPEGAEFIEEDTNSSKILHRASKIHGERVLTPELEYSSEDLGLLIQKLAQKGRVLGYVD